MDQMTSGPQTMIGSYLLDILVLLTTYAIIVNADKGCPNSPLWEEYIKVHGNRCYEFHVGKRVTWSAAAYDCLSRGGYLVTVRSLAEEQFIMGVLRSYNFGDLGVWIGLNDRDVEGHFLWTSGDNSTFRFWAPGQPLSTRRRRSTITDRHETDRHLQQRKLSNLHHHLTNIRGQRFLLPSSNHNIKLHLGFAQDCVLLKYTDSGRWHDYPCEKLDLLGLVKENYPYICEYPRLFPTTSHIPTTAISTSASTSPPTTTDHPRSTVTTPIPTQVPTTDLRSPSKPITQKTTKSTVSSTPLWMLPRNTSQSTQRAKGNCSECVATKTNRVPEIGIVIAG